MRALRPSGEAPCLWLLCAALLAGGCRGLSDARSEALASARSARDLPSLAHAVETHHLLGEALPEELGERACTALARAPAPKSAGEAEEAALLATRATCASASAPSGTEDAAASAVRSASDAEAVRAGVSALAALSLLPAHSHGVSSALSGLSSLLDASSGLFALSLNSSAGDAFATGCALSALASLPHSSQRDRLSNQFSLDAIISASAAEGDAGSLELLGSGRHEEEHANLFATARVLDGAARLGLKASTGSLSRLARFVTGPVASSPTAEHAAHVALALTSLSSSSNLPAPPLLAVESSQIALDTPSPSLEVKVVDALGNALAKCKPSVSALHGPQNLTHLPKLKAPKDSAGAHTLDLSSLAATARPGFYTASASADCSSSWYSSTGTQTASLAGRFQLAKSAHVHSVTVTTANSNGSRYGASVTAGDSGAYPLLSWTASEGTSLDVSVRVADALGNPFAPSRMFAQLLPDMNDNLAASVPLRKRSDGSATARALLSIESVEQQLGGLESGRYTLVVHLGGNDVVSGRAIPAATVSVDAATRAASPLVRKPSVFTTMPEMVHVEKPKEKRPPTAIALIFTLLAVAPYGAAAMAAHRLGVNLKALKRRLKEGSGSVLAFGMATAAYAGSVLVFWLRLNLLQAAPLLGACMAGMVASGRAALSRLHEQRSEKAERKEQ
jgi:hypothetical protein